MLAVKWPDSWRPTPILFSLCMGLPVLIWLPVLRRSASGMGRYWVYRVPGSQSCAKSQLFCVLPREAGATLGSLPGTSGISLGHLTSLLLSGHAVGMSHHLGAPDSRAQHVPSSCWGFVIHSNWGQLLTTLLHMFSGRGASKYKFSCL